MPDGQHPEVEAAVRRLGHLIGEGGRLREALARDAASATALGRMAVWQRDCAAAIGQLSGGSKTHWLARAYSQAFLAAEASDHPGGEIPLATIVDRILGVLDEARRTVVRADPGAAPPSNGGPGRPVRFDFVHEAALRPHLERAYAEGRAAFARGAFVPAFVMACSVLEAILTDALQHAASRGTTLDPGGTSLQARPDDITAWSLAARIEAARRAGLISAACARLPESAHRYRELLDDEGDIRPDASVSDREARLAGQVLTIIIRDLTPGR